MLRSVIACVAAFLFLPCISFSQKLRKADLAVIATLEKHVNFLAADRLEGRRAGSPGENLAKDYIAEQFQAAGLVPYGDNKTWFQSFPIDEGLSIAPGSFLQVNGHAVDSSHFFPFPGSPGTAVEAEPSIALRETGMPWFLNLKEMLDIHKDNPHFDLANFIALQAADAAKKGALALVVYNTGSAPDGLSFSGKTEPPAFKIPVIYVDKPTALQYFADESTPLTLRFKAVFEHKKRTGHNVVGYINNGAASTIICGAHFDHLGYGEDDNSLYRGTVKLVHNGADDNASGTAALIELAKMLKDSRLRKNNYLFIAFSGEELGLFGSKFYTSHPTADLSQANYMINLDMVGRLNDSTKTLFVGGYGTSPAWGNVFAAVRSDPSFTDKFDSSGTGPSDHTSFYLKNIPVLFFFTGVHPDYHRPSDDADKINYTGIYRIVKYIYAIVAATNNKGKLPFSKTRDMQLPGPVSLNVTLGIMPDYAFTGSGVRADAVSADKPAQHAGMQPGDIIIRLGDYPVQSLESYMQALNRFHKGDKTMVKVKRGTATIDLNAQF